jgi:AsmA protein
MNPRQLNWKWLLLGFAVLVLAAVAIFPRLAGDSAELQRRAIAALSDWAGGEVMLTGPLTVHYFPDVAIKCGFELRDPARLPPVQSIASNDAKLTLDLPALLGGRISIDALRLNNPEIVLKDPAPSAPASQETQAARIANLFAGTHVRTVRLRDGRITLPPSLGGETIDEVQARFAASANAGAMSSFGTFEFRNETVRFALDSAKPAATETGAAVPVGLTLNSLPLVLKFSGNATIDDGLKLDGQLQTEIADARRLFRWSGIALPEGTSLQGLTASGTAHFRGTTLSFDDGVFTLDGNTADGVLSVAMGERPRLEGTFDFERLVLDPYLAGSVRPETVQAQGADFDRVLLNHFDADLRVSAAEIAAAGLKLGRGAFTLSAKGGVLASEIGELELCGGEGTGRIGADLTQQAAKANLAATLTNVSLETCLQPLGLMAPLKGTGGLKIEATTEGNGWDEAVKRLTGELKLNAQNGSVPIDLGRLLGAAVPLDGDGWAQGNGTAFDRLASECRLAVGHIWCQAFDMQTQGRLISGTGDVDLVRQTLDWNLTAAEADNAAADPARTTAPRISIRGPLAEPMIRRADRPTFGEGSTGASPLSNPVSPR